MREIKLFMMVGSSRNMILYIRGFPATDLVKYDGSLDDGYLEIILVHPTPKAKYIHTMFSI